jgi:hypothetical protein
MSAWKSNCVSPFILCSLVLFYTLSAFIEVYFLFLFGGIRKHLLSLVWCISPLAQHLSHAASSLPLRQICGSRGWLAGVGS